MRLWSGIAVCLVAGATGLTAGAVAADDTTCEAPCVWERQFGGNGDQGEDTAYVLAHGFELDDGGAVVVGTRLAQGNHRVWVGRLDADAATVWEGTVPGSACNAARIDDAVVVLATGGAPGDDARRVLRFADDGTHSVVVAATFAAGAVAPDGRGGFLVLGRHDDGSPAVAAYDSAGDRRWIWTPAWLSGVAQGGVMAAAPLPDGGARLLGHVLTDGFRGGAAAIWTAVIDADGMVRDRVVVDLVDQTQTEQFCFTPQTRWSIDAVGTDALIRYVGFYGDLHRMVLARVDAGGQILWQQGRPGPAGAEASPRHAADPDGIETITSAAVTADGGAIVAGYRFSRSTRENVGFVARLDSDGTEGWRQEWPGSVDGGFWPTFGSAVETSDGGVLAVAAESRRRAAVRYLAIDAAAGGAAP